MRTPPRYKTARRLGASVYEKTQGPKFALRMQQRSTKREFTRPKTDYGAKMLEKQRVRFSYGLSEKQFSRYVENAIEAKTSNHEEALYQMLETRLDNTIYRAGLAPTRQSARQMVSHGHVSVNGTRVTIPSFKVSVDDIIRPRDRSLKKKLFEDIEKRLTDAGRPSWILCNIEKREFKIQGMPKAELAEVYATLRSILEFYKK